MKFLVDAQLPRHLSHWLKQRGHDSLHTLDLPDGNRTSDLEGRALKLSATPTKVGCWNGKIIQPFEA